MHQHPPPESFAAKAAKRAAIPALTICLAATLLAISTFSGSTDDGPASLIVPRPESAEYEPSIFGQPLETQRGDLQDLVNRRAIRVLVAINRTHFFLDGLTQRGIVADGLREFEDYVNERFNAGTRRIQVIPIPMDREQLIEGLEQGYGDIAASDIAITPERRKRVDFSLPIYRNVNEVVVAHAAAPPLETLEELSGRRVYVHPSGNHYQSLRRANEYLRLRGRDPIEIVSVEESFEAEDILELVNAGVFPMTVADSHIAEFWADVLPHLRVYSKMPLQSGTKIGWAIRHDALNLKPVVDAFIERSREGTLLGNVLLQRYLEDQQYVRNANRSEDHVRLAELAPLFQRYAEDYDFDWRMLAAQAYQESGLDNSQRSASGAVGIMQLLPSTANDPNVGIADIRNVENNVHAGTKYMRHVMDTYFAIEEMDTTNRFLFTLAAYNAGPSRILAVREEAKTKRLNPNRWFGHVERVAAERIGRQPVHYVRNIHKYYTTLTLADFVVEQKPETL